MYKRILALSFVFMLAFSPLSAIAAEVDESNENKENESAELDNEEADEEEATDDTVEDADSVDATEEDSEENEEESDEEVNEADEAKEEEEAETDEGEVKADDEEASTYATEDEEELDLSNISGTASGDIEYDIEKGYYVLDVRAGFSKIWLGLADIKDKWVAFALPNGVEIADELPKGVVSVNMAGKTGIAVKVPNVTGEAGSEYVSKKIPLTGVDNDNDPVYNLYMLEVDTESNQYEEIGEVKGQRDIDFSEMEENPSIDLTGSINGETKFDSSQEKVYYLLDVTAEIENDAYEDMGEDLYVGFDLPEGVAVLDNEDTPKDIKTMNLGEGKEGVGLKLPALDKDQESQEITYTIPVIGMSDEVVQSDTINLYTFPAAGSYNPVGKFPGNISVDFSNMDEEWFFDIKNEVITDYPGVNDNQKGFRFNYTTKNLTLDDVDEVSMEFTVPNGITIEKPQYIGSDVDIDWDGNVATVTLGDLSGGSGYYGYFTAVGTTSKSIEELKDTEVTVTLNRDGATEVITLSSPFVEGEFDEADFDPVDPGNGEDPDNGKDPGNGKEPGDDDNGKPGNDDGTTPGNGGGDDGTTPGSGDNGKGTDEDNATIDVEDGDDSVDEGDIIVASGDDSLPKTATNTYTFMLIGVLLALVGGTFLAVRKVGLNK